MDAKDMEYQMTQHELPILEFAKRHYGSLRQMAYALDVDPTTVSKWHDKPHNFLKYAKELRDTSDATINEIWEVVERAIDQ